MITITTTHILIVLITFLVLGKEYRLSATIGVAMGLLLKTTLISLLIIVAVALLLPLSILSIIGCSENFKQRIIDWLDKKPMESIWRKNNE